MERPPRSRVCASCIGGSWRWAPRPGSQRALATTPYEHQPALERSLEPQAHVADITEAYVQVRYAEDEPSDAELADLAERLQRVQPKPSE